jgi:hypothetical protein
LCRLTDTLSVLLWGNCVFCFALRERDHRLAHDRNAHILGKPPGDLFAVYESHQTLPLFRAANHCTVRRLSEAVARRGYFWSADKHPSPPMESVCSVNHSEEEVQVPLQLVTNWPAELEK